MSHNQLSTELDGRCKCHNNPLPLPTVCKYEKSTANLSDVLRMYVITGPAAVSCSMSSLLRRNVSAISRRRSSCASLSSWPATAWSPASRSVSSWEQRKEHMRCRAKAFLLPFVLCYTCISRDWGHFVKWIADKESDRDVVIKGTVSWDRFQKCWRKWADLVLNKGRGWFLNFSEAPLIFSWNKTPVSR